MLKVYASLSNIRFVEYKPTSLEKNYKHEMLTEVDLGVNIDLIDPDTYALNPNGKMMMMVMVMITLGLSLMDFNPVYLLATEGCKMSVKAGSNFVCSFQSQLQRHVV